MSSLLEMAKQIITNKSNNKYSQESFDLALGWAKGEISAAQMRHVLGKNQRGNYLYYAAMALRWGIINEKLVENKKTIK
jgi:hypothetical protein